MTVTFVLHIDALDPKTLTLARLAEYMNRFAKILGHEEGVHFDGIRSGSTTIACRVDPNHAELVGESLQVLVDGRGAKASRSAHESMMKMLERDKAKASIFEGEESGVSGRKIMEFSQALPRNELEMEVIEHDDEVSGYLIDIDATRDRQDFGFVRKIGSTPAFVRSERLQRRWQATSIDRCASSVIPFGPELRRVFGI